MINEQDSDLGQISLSEDVLATMAGVAAIECPGIVGMASTRLKDGLAELLGRENLSRGVEVTLSGGQAEIDLYIVVGYGTRITEVAQNVSQKVRYTVETMTGLKVADVRIHVQGVKVGR